MGFGLWFEFAFGFVVLLDCAAGVLAGCCICVILCVGWIVGRLYCCGLCAWVLFLVGFWYGV